MLKIKDNIDLKKLEKYGFQQSINDISEYYFIRLTASSNYAVLIISPITRKLTIDTGSTYIDELNVLYDLIKDGLVEKVEDK